MTATSDLHGAERSLERAVERRLRAAHLDRLAREAQRRHVLFVNEQASRVGHAHDRLRHHLLDLRRSHERQSAGEVGLTQSALKLRQARATATQVDPSRKLTRFREFLEHQLYPGSPNGDIFADDEVDFAALLDRSALRKVDLDFLRPPEREIEPIGQRLCEGATAKRKHACRVDAALAHQRYVGRPATDVDEQRARLADLLLVETARHGIRLGDYSEQLQVELARHALQRAEVDQRRERIERAEADVAALETDGVSYRVSVDGRARHRRVHQPDVDVPQARFPRNRTLRFAQRIAFDAFEHALELDVGDWLIRLLALVRARCREPLDELAGDADYDLGRAEAGHLFSFLERDL